MQYILAETDLSDKPSPISIVQELDSAISSVQWCGNKYFNQCNQGEDPEIQRENESIKEDQSYDEINKTLIILTHNGTIYTSFNDGYDFDYTRNLLNKAASKIMTQKFDQVHYTSIREVIISKANPYMVFFIGQQGISYSSNDCGKSFKAFQHDQTIMEFKPSAANDSVILGSANVKCPLPDCMDVLKDLYLTEDLGVTWKKIRSFVTQYAWAYTEKYSLFFIPKERIILGAYNASNWQSIKLKQAQHQILYSNDYFENVEVISQNGLSFYLTKPYIFVMEPQLNKSPRLLIADAQTRQYNLKQIKIPVNKLNDNAFNILESKHGVIFININHYGPLSKFGNIYVSNFYGQTYSLSLLNNVRDASGFADFNPIESLEGVYIANHYDFHEVDLYKQQMQNAYQTGSKIDSRIHQYQRSVISFDQGASWQDIEAPESNFKGKPLNCNGECSLHLRGHTDQTTSSIYSHKSSTGIIIGIGNTGHYLTQDNTQLRTYLSRDGGHKWTEVMEGSHIYEVGDHGGLIVMVKDQELTDQILYSWDEGLSWNTFKIKVGKINIEPESMSQNFILYGSYDESGKVVAIDFNPLNQRVCKGIYKPGTKNSDYEYWVPAQQDSKCLLGKKLKYVRRKQNSQCWNDEDYERKVIVEYCECTEHDWECDFDYYRASIHDPCKPISDQFKNDDSFSQNDQQTFKPPDDCQGTYEVPSGYRRIPGDFCNGGIDKGPVKINCPTKGKDSNSFFSSFTNSEEQKDQQSETKDVQKKQPKSEIEALIEKKGQEEKDEQEEVSQVVKEVMKFENQRKQREQTKSQKISDQTTEDNFESQQSRNWTSYIILIALLGLFYMFKENVSDLINNIINKISRSTNYDRLGTGIIRNSTFEDDF